mgnify:FL=1
MEVTLYSTHTCGYCRQAKEYLSRRGVPFREVNVAADHTALAEMVRLSGQRGVPVIVIDGQVVVGFDRPRLEQLLGQASEGGGGGIGLSVADAHAYAERHRLQLPAGAYVGRVRPGSPAQRAGLQAGDVITAILGWPIRDDKEVVGLLPTLKGQRVTMDVWRDGRTLELQMGL